MSCYGFCCRLRPPLAGFSPSGTGGGRDVSRGSDPSPAYFSGLNYLLNEQPDKAIDVFVKLLEVDSDTVETHLALGNLFRRRGEVERAIRIHQNLIARPTLSREQRGQALLELGQDYMRAGLFDRAENLFKELGEMNLHQEQALDNLHIIYQQEKEWGKALDVAKRLGQVTGRSYRTERAHYYCELAEEALQRRDSSMAGQMLKKAQVSDDRCIRASILKGGIECDSNLYRAALRSYKRIEKQDPVFLSEVLEQIIACHHELGETTELFDYLSQLQTGGVAGSKVALELAGMIEKREGRKAAIDYLTQRLEEQPDLQGLARLLALSMDEMSSEQKGVRKLKELLDRLNEQRSAYQCSGCGFVAKTLHWQCPSCKTWGSIKPRLGLEIN